LTTVCAILSDTVGIPSLLVPPFAFGISTCFTGGGKYELRDRDRVLADIRIAGEIQQELELAEAAVAVQAPTRPDIPPAFLALENTLWRMVTQRFEEGADAAASPA
jgi:hypothetical protein